MTVSQRIFTPKLSKKIWGLIGLSLIIIGGCFLWFSPKKQREEYPKKKIIGEIAIIIDDWGYNRHHCSMLSRIHIPITVSILPQLTYTADVVSCAHSAGKEIMIHLPLEPHHFHEAYPSNYIITTEMNKNEILEIFNRAIKENPYAVGINPHMGSKATENISLMKEIFALLKKHDLFFVDSRSTKETICKKLASKMGIPFAERNIFLDNTKERSYIENQFLLLAQRARVQGFAIGIGHDNMLTLEVLAQQGELLTRQGFKFVTVRNLIKHLDASEER